MTGPLTVAQLAEYQAYADKCDGRHRPTRCRSCAIILTLIAHIRLTERGDDGSTTNG